MGGEQAPKSFYSGIAGMCWGGMGGSCFVGTSGIVMGLFLVRLRMCERVGATSQQKAATGIEVGGGAPAGSLRTF